MSGKPHVVVLGAGFAGVGALQELRDAAVRVTVVDRNDYHTFLPLLYQVATNQLGPEHINTPIESLISNREGFGFLQGQVTGLDLRARQVNLEGRESVTYDYLLIGLGARVNFFGIGGAREHAFPLYTMVDAERLRTHIFECIESAGKDQRLVEDGLLRFCVVGGGATGVEVSAAIAELLQSRTGDSGFPSGETEVHVFEMEDELLTPFKPRLRRYAQRELEERGVQVHLGEAVTAVGPTRVTLRSGAVVKAHTVVWAAGLEGHPLAGSLGIRLESGLLPTEKDLSLRGHPEVFVAGDVAAITDSKSGRQLPQLGSVAQQSGQRAGANISLLAGGEPTRRFEYTDKGTMAMIGRGAAIVQMRSGRTMTGKPAWLAWKGVHLMLLAGGEQKARTLLEWGKGFAGLSSR